MKHLIQDKQFEETVLLRKIPHILHLYWDLSPMSYLQYLTVVSFNKYNENWKIMIWLPEKPGFNFSWKGFEQKNKYTGKDYFYLLNKIKNVEFHNIEMKSIGFDDGKSEVYKSDYLRYHVLGTHGGLWADFDIIFIKSFSNLLKGNNILVEKNDGNENGIDTLIVYYKQNKLDVFPIGMLASSKSNPFFIYLRDNCKQFIDESVYQSIGTIMLKKLLVNPEEIRRQKKSFGNMLILDKASYLPFDWNKINDIFTEYKPNFIKDNTIGIHWFNGSPDSSLFKNLIENNNYNNTNSSIYEYISDYLIDKRFLDQELDSITYTNGVYKDKYPYKILNNGFYDNNKIKYIKQVFSIEKQYSKGLIISTYFSNDSGEKRLEIIKCCLDSLSKNIANDVYVGVLVDGCTNQEHLDLLNKYDYDIILKIQNEGITKIKNISLQLLKDKGIQYGFIADDDIIFLDPNWTNTYIDALQKSRVNLLSFYPLDNFKTEVNVVNLDSISLNHFKFGYAGCFLVMNLKIIDEIGYFNPKFKKLLGEHVNFQKKYINYLKLAGVTEGTIDIIDSTKYLTLNKDSIGKSAVNETEVLPNLDYEIDKFYKEPFKIFGESLSNKPKISIVMAYFNRIEQTLFTLRTMQDSNFIDFEVIIVDDGSNKQNLLDNLIKDFNIQIKLVKMDTTKKNYFNPCVPFNVGFLIAKGDIVVLQNPECCHIGDILSFIDAKLKENDYFTFTCANLAEPEYNQELKYLYEQKDNFNEITKFIDKLAKKYKNTTKIWYNHCEFRPANFHFLSAIKMTNLEKLGGFDERYAFGTCFDDTELLERIRKEGLDIKLIGYSNLNPFSIHQWHPVRPSAYKKDLWDINYELFKKHMKDLNIDLINLDKWSI